MSVEVAATEGASTVATFEEKSVEEKMVTAAAEPKKAADHPKYAAMIQDGLSVLKERGGSSRQALLKYIIKHYNLGQDEKVINAHLKLALRAGVKTGTLKQSKGVGASGSFKLGTEKEHRKEAKTTKMLTKAVVKKVKSATQKKAKNHKKATESAKPKKPIMKKPKSPSKATKAAKPKAATKNPKPVAAKEKKPKEATPAKAKKPRMAAKAAKPKKAAAKK